MFKVQSFFLSLFYCSLFILAFCKGMYFFANYKIRKVSRVVEKIASDVLGASDATNKIVHKILKYNVLYNKK